MLDPDEGKHSVRFLGGGREQSNTATRPLKTCLTTNQQWT
jgi:hypothetical protein